MKATELLKKQHQIVEKLFEQLEGGGGDAMAIREELAKNLVGHMVIEEKIFYPTVAKELEKDGKDLVLESFEEHAMAAIALTRVLQTEIDEVTFKPRVKTLKEMILHHVEEEEEDLFPDVEEKMGDKLEELGMRMQQLFEETVQQGYVDILMKEPNLTTRKQERVAEKSVKNGAAKPQRTANR